MEVELRLTNANNTYQDISLQILNKPWMEFYILHRCHFFVNFRFGNCPPSVLPISEQVYNKFCSTSPMLLYGNHSQ